MGKAQKTKKLSVREWQLEHIKEGVRQAEAGNFATAAEVRAVFRRFRLAPERVTSARRG
jgi:predicted transcriptional regulator